AQPAGSGLPVRRELPSSPGFAPERLSAPVNAGLLAEIAAAADRLELTEAEFLFTSWCVFLWRWSEQRGGPIGFVSDGRPYDELREVMGLLARCLPVEPEITRAMPFSSAAAGIQARLREAQEWQDYFLFAPAAARADEAP